MQQHIHGTYNGNLSIDHSGNGCHNGACVSTTMGTGATAGATAATATAAAAATTLLPLLLVLLVLVMLLLLNLLYPAEESRSSTSKCLPVTFKNPAMTE